MAVTTLLQWNPNQTNQETDAVYASDSQRTGGATNPSLFPSATGNKLFNQLSNYLFAMFTAFANKGYGTSDSNINTLIAQCANFLTTADIKPSLIYVLFASTLVFDCSKANGFQVTLSGSMSFTLSHAVVGQRILLAFSQDSSGNHTVTYPGTVRTPGTPALAAGSSSVQEFIVLADNLLHPITAMAVS